MPNLNGNIFLRSPLLEIISKPGPKGINNIENFSSNISSDHYQKINRFSAHYAVTHLVNDNRPNGEIPAPWLFVYLFSSGEMRCPGEIMIYFAGTQPYWYFGTISLAKISKRGLVKFQIKEIVDENFDYSGQEDYDLQKEILLRETFFAVRNLYHKHTHHVNNGNNDDIPDSLTLPSFKTGDNEAVRDILGYYQEKIVEYNNYSCDLIVKSENNRKVALSLSTSSMLQRQAKGCFIYGMQLVELYKNFFTDEEYRYNVNMFKNAMNSIQAFCDEINTKYNAMSASNLKKISLNSILLAILIALLSAISLFSRVLFDDKNPYFVIICLILVLVFAVVYELSIVGEIPIISNSEIDRIKAFFHISHES